MPPKPVVKKSTKRKTAPSSKSPSPKKGAKAAKKRSPRKKPKRSSNAPRDAMDLKQLRLVDPETGEAVNEVYRNKRVDDAYYSYTDGKAVEKQLKKQLKERDAENAKRVDLVEQLDAIQAKIDAMDDKDKKRLELEEKIASASARVKARTDNLKDVFAQEKPAMLEALEEGCHYTTSDVHGRLRDIWLDHGAERIIDQKSQYKRDTSGED